MMLHVKQNIISTAGLKKKVTEVPVPSQEIEWAVYNMCLKSIRFAPV